MESNYDYGQSSDVCGPMHRSLYSLCTRSRLTIFLEAFISTTGPFNVRICVWGFYTEFPKSLEGNLFTDTVNKHRQRRP